MKIKLFYFAVSIIVFILVIFFAIGFGVQRVPAPGFYISSGEFIEMPTGMWEFKTSPIFYLGNNSYTGLSNVDYLIGHPLVLLYWYFLGLIVTFILYKIRFHRFFKFLN